MTAIARAADIPASGDTGSHPCQEALDALRAEAATHFGAAGARVTPVAFDERPFSYVLRAAIQHTGEDRPRSHVFIKVFKPRSGSQRMYERVLHDFETTRRIHQTMSEWDILGAIRPIACYPDQLAIVTEEAPGQTLGALLDARARWFPNAATLRELEETLTTVGTWIRIFQTIDTAGTSFSLDELRSYIDVRLERLVREPRAAFTEADRSRILNHFDRRAPLVPVSDSREVLVHADMAPGNVLVDGRRVVVLDFAMTHHGSVMQDVSRLYAQLDLMRAKPYFRRKIIRALQAALLRGFDPNLTERRDLFRLLLLRHHVNHLATLSVRPERLPAAMYNAHLRRFHRRWLGRELASEDHVRESAHTGVDVGSTPARILEVATYPPPRSGWAVRVELLKKRLDELGHRCVVLNIGASRTIPSTEYETVLSGADFLRKVWRYSVRGFVVHAHANGDAPKGAVLALVAEIINLVCGRRCYLTFHAGAIQRYFPRNHAWWLVPLYWLLFTIPRRIICNSEAVKRRIRGYGIPGGKIVPIPAFSRQYLEFTPSMLPTQLDAFFQRFPLVIFTYVRMRRLFFPLAMIDGMAAVMRHRGDVGLVLCGGLTHMDAGVWPLVQERIRSEGLEDRICQIDDLDHDLFLTALQRSAIYLRTPITDGVASSVMEALALRVPVVASENGTRPAGCLTYPPEDSARMAAAIEHVLERRGELVGTMATLEVADTLSDEIALLTGA